MPGSVGGAEAAEDVEGDHVHPEEGVKKAELGKRDEMGFKIC